MSEERIAAGVERIERALARIRAARAMSAPPAPVVDEGLAERHAQLRDEVAESVRELDEVLADG